MLGNTQKRKVFSPLERQPSKNKKQKLDGDGKTSPLRKISPKTKTQGGIVKTPKVMRNEQQAIKSVTKRNIRVPKRSFRTEFKQMLITSAFSPRSDKNNKPKLG